ncbi:MAG: xanthine dehydrogenase family protein subunit M [Xanthobacteraceae bacterium]
MNEHLQPQTMGGLPPPSAPLAPADAIATYLAPRTLEEALTALRAGPVTIFAGGTDVMPQSRSGRVRLNPTLMNIRRIPDLRGISEGDGFMRFGALTTITELLENAQVRARFNALWQSCDHFASGQLRNAATLGGNICNASPAGDTIIPLLALDARIVLASQAEDGAATTRTMPLAAFFVAPGRTRRRPEELLIAVEVPLPPEGFVSEFYKFGTRPALDISAISIGLGALPAAGALTNVRVAFGAVAPTPIRAAKTESALEGRPLAAAMDAALAAADADICPISDVRASAWYRRELVRNVLRGMLDHVGRG